MNPDVVTEFEIATWNRCAESYAETFAMLTNEAVPLLVESAGVSSGKRVLEIGCGPGNVAAKLAAAGADVDAVDFSESMIEAAKKAHPDIRFQQANAEKLPFEDGTFDAVVANYAVHHFARPADVFKEIGRVLKPGGRFAFAVWGPQEEQSSVGAFFGAVMAHHDLAELPHGPLFGVTDAETFEKLFEGTGLSNFKLDLHKVAWKADSLAPVLRGFWDWGNMAALPKEKQDKIEASTRENAKAFEQDGGKYVFPHSLVLGCASK